ncbi:MAG: Fic family protein [Planctomycetaceae bacterium]
MRNSDFVDGRSPGRMTPIDGGLHAFVPHALPPRWEMPSEFWPLVRDAWANIKELNGIGRLLKNPTILLKPLENREAIQSSRIEGTFATAKELLLFEKAPRGDNPNDQQRSDWREVWNYRQALIHGLRSPLPISKRLICELHKVLLSGVRGEDKRPGEFRRVQVGIRGKAGDPAFVPPPYSELDSCLNDLESYIHSPSEQIDPLVDCFLVHYQFETIHPFRDGNGRVGRLLLALMVKERCILSQPWLFVSQYFEKHQSRYFELLYQVSSQAAWSEWIRFCLEGTVAQAQDTLDRCQRILDVQESLKQQLSPLRGSNKLLPIIDLVLEKMYVSVNDVIEEFGVTYPTANAYLLKLLNQGILRQLDNVPQKMYYSPEIFKITYSDLAGSEEQFVVP